MKLFFPDPEFDAQLQRTVSHSYEMGADVGECLAIAQRIQVGSYDSWHQEWLKAAERTQQLAEACLGRGRRVSACEAFLRASEYFRAAYFFCRGRRS